MFNLKVILHNAKRVRQKKLSKGSIVRYAQFYKLKETLEYLLVINSL